MKNILVSPNLKIIQSMKKLAVTGERCLIVIDKKNKLLGTLNDGDIRRGLLQKLKLDDIFILTQSIGTRNKNIFTLPPKLYAHKRK